jgi:hypothetical protein
MDMIDLMPPGLYEAVISGVDESVVNPELVQGEYLFTLETRTLDDIRALGGNTPEDDMRFAAASRVSEINQGLYRTFASPAVSMAATEESAELLRRMHPNRLRFLMFSDQNPFMLPFAAAVDWVRSNRAPVDANNPFSALERMMSDFIANSLEAWGKARDALEEEIFLNTYGAPWLQAMVGLRTDHVSATRRIERDLAREAAASEMASQLRQRIENGGLAEATVRALLYVRLPESMADERGFAALKRIGSELPAAKRLGLTKFKEIVKEQFLILRLDEEKAIAALPKLLPDDRRACQTALSLIHRVIEARGALPEEGRGRLRRIEALFAGPPTKAGRERQAALTGVEQDP